MTIGTDAEFEDAELRVAEGETGFTLELWSQEPELFSIGFLSPTGEQIGRIPNHTLTEQRITFVLENTVIYLNYQVAEAGTGSQLIVMRFVKPTPGIWRIRVYNSLYLRGEYHLWLPSKGFISDDTFFLRPSPDTVVTEPGNASQTITATETAAFISTPAGATPAWAASSRIWLLQASMWTAPVSRDPPVFPCAP